MSVRTNDMGSRASALVRGLKRAAIAILLAFVVLAASVVIWVVYPRSPAPDAAFYGIKGTLARVETRSRDDVGGTITEDLVIVSDTGLELRALVRRPARADGPLAAVVLLGGIESGRRGLLRIDTDRYPFLWLALDYPYELPQGALSYRDAWGELRRATSGAKRTVAGLMLALDYLMSREDVDPERIVAGGGSLGSFPVVLAGAMDDRFSAVVLLYGGGDVPRIIERNLPWESATLKRLAVEGLNPWLGPLEPTKFVGRIAPRPLLMVNGTGDTMFPRSSVEALYESAGEPKELVWLETPHRIIDRPEDLNRALAEATTWLAEHGFLGDRDE